MTPRRILVRLPTWVGDVVMATPVLRALRRAHPDAEIVLEGKGFLRGLLAGLDTFDDFLPDPGKGFAALRKRARDLRARRFDWAVLLPDSARAASGPWLARIPVRAGYARDLPRRVMLTDKLQVPRDERGKRIPVPMPERYLAITRALGVVDEGTPRTELVVDSAAADSVAERLARHELSAARLVVVSPGAAFGASKLYPAAQLAAACDGLHAELGLHAVFAPGPGEEALAHEVAAAMSAPAVVLDEPVTSLAELVALTDRSALALCNDTGPRHIAVALGTPCVTLMGPTDPRHTDFALERQRVLRSDDPSVDCMPCHEKTCPIDHRCMTTLPPSRVVAAARELLDPPR